MTVRACNAKKLFNIIIIITLLVLLCLCWYCAVKRHLGFWPLLTNKPFIVAIPLDGRKNGSKPFLKSLTLTTGVPSCVMSSVRGCSTKTVWNGLNVSVSLIKFTHSDGFTTLSFLLFFSMWAKSRSQGNLLWPERGYKTWISSRFLWIIE